ncbi:MAG: hypothetical protein NVS4B2_13430 [Chloroflexota bacterium]
MLDLSASLSNPRRLRALRRVALLDTSVDQAFDRLTRLVARFLNVPVALVSLVDEERQVFRGCIGLPEPWASARETPLSHSFCKHVVHLGTPLVISDARDHALVRDNLAIPDLLVVAYAGIPLITSDGSVLGTLCAIDHEPRDWSEVDLSTLADLAASVMTELELVAALRQSAQRADRIARLQAMTAALSDAITPPHAGDVVLRHGLPAVGATAGTVALLRDEGEAMEIIAHRGYQDDHVEPFRRFSVDLPVPMADAVRTRLPVFLESPDVWNTYYPDVELHTVTGGQAAAAIPLFAGNRVIGALGLSFAAVRDFQEEDRSYMIALAHQCAQSLEHARLYLAGLDARAQAEEARERLEFILDAGMTIAAAPDYRTALQSLAQLVVASLADGCIIDVLQNNESIKRVAVVLADQDHRSVAEQVLVDFPPRLGSEHPAAEVIQTGRAASGALDTKLVQLVSGNKKHAAMIEGLGFTSYMCVPLIARDEVFGALSLLSCSPRYEYDESDLGLAQELGRRAAAVIDTGRLYEELQRDA